MLGSQRLSRKRLTIRPISRPLSRVTERYLGPLFSNSYQISAFEPPGSGFSKSCQSNSGALCVLNIDFLPDLSRFPPPLSRIGSLASCVIKKTRIALKEEPDES